MPQESNSLDLRKELDEVYVSIEEAKEEIWKRWNNKELKTRVESSLNGDLPEVLKVAPRAVISRHVMSPNFELLNFLESAKKVGIAPVGFEYVHDKFVTKNEDKYYLGKMFFYEGIGKHGGRKTSSVKVVDFDLFDGKKISEVTTLSGESFVSLHHTIVSPVLSESDIVDMSDYYLRNGGQAVRYYRYILSLFIAHGVLFENFLLNGFYSELTENIFLPTYRSVVRDFGVRPLIVRLVPGESEEDVSWRQYPEEYKEAVSAIMKGKGQFSGHIKI
jgi:hypothetical protein